MGKTAVLAFGRMNPPTRAHELLVKTMAKQDGDPVLYLSHKQDSKGNPLSYDQKIYWCQMSFGHLVEVVESEARNMYEAAQELNRQGYTDLIYLCGSDRIEDAKRMASYNGKKDKNGNLVYNFNSIKFVKVGNDRINEDDVPLEAVSASRQREYAKEGDIESFMAGCPSGLNEENCYALYEDVRKGLGLVETLEELYSIEEAQMATDDIIKHDYYDRVVKDLSNKKSGVLMKDGDTYYIDDQKVLSQLNKLKREADKNNKVNKFNDLTGLNWRNIEKSPYSGSGNSNKDIPIQPNTKTFTPVSLLSSLDSYIPLNQLPGSIEFKDSNNPELNKNITELLQKVVSDCIIKANITRNSDVIDYLKGDAISASGNTFSLEASYDIKKILNKINPNLINMMKSPFKNNFGEIFGCASLASVLKKSSYVNFPGASNYPISDYFISDSSTGKGSFKVSAKAAKLGKSGSPVSEGGKPGCAPIVKKIYEGLKDGTLDKKNFKPDFIQFIEFIMDNVVNPVGMHVTYENLANSLANPPRWLKFSLPGELRRFTVNGSVNAKTIGVFSKLIGKEKEALKVRKVNNKDYYETFRVKYMCQIFIKALNSNDSIISQFTKAISLLFGVFIQLYVDDNSDFTNGNIRMFGEVVSANGEPLKISGKGYHYEFLDNSSVDKNYKMGTTKLSMKLKQ